MTDNVEGTIKGTITHATTGAVREFNSVEVGRSALGGDLNAWGYMHSSTPDEAISFSLFGSDPSSGTYYLGRLPEMRNAYFHPGFGLADPGIIGSLFFNNDKDATRIHGSLHFETRADEAGNRYKIDVDFDITGVSSAVDDSPLANSKKLPGQSK